MQDDGNFARTARFTGWLQLEVVDKCQDLDFAPAASHPYPFPSTIPFGPLCEPSVELHLVC